MRAPSLNTLWRHPLVHLRQRHRRQDQMAFVRQTALLGVTRTAISQTQIKRPERLVCVLYPYATPSLPSPLHPEHRLLSNAKSLRLLNGTVHPYHASQKNKTPHPPKYPNSDALPPFVMHNLHKSSALHLHSSTRLRSPLVVFERHSRVREGMAVLVMQAVIYQSS